MRKNCVLDVHVSYRKQYQYDVSIRIMAKRQSAVQYRTFPFPGCTYKWQHDSGRIRLVSLVRVCRCFSEQTSTGFKLHCCFLRWLSSVLSGFQCRTRPRLLLPLNFLDMQYEKQIFNLLGSLSAFFCPRFFWTCFFTPILKWLLKTNFVAC